MAIKGRAKQSISGYCGKQAERHMDTKEKPLAFYDSINGAAFLAQPAVDALGHVDVISRCPSAPIHTLFGFDSDGLRRTNCLAELASNATLLACGISP
jgi:hypothetical protein